jgi:hypothetical protein
LDAGLDSVFVENGRNVHRRPDAHSNSPFSHAHANSTSQSDANANPNAESRPGM